ncbi:hypothetical protein GYMLUDRAFT_87122 [Collybiopsis luxurians FD-317 M1]|uniref:Uncharacterized protein n=1 Tax=Collybiopsis luxurians FD-317 M1 TaxID=944289 RepID=A0A0D0B1U3_9AGAR|nr:hypothetical protein GYMLUDRAFT_87122 [Collybiopsis luxurians FD-317 M1]
MDSAVETKSVTELLQYLDGNDNYKDCKVIAVTHSKNMDSLVLHEYLHINIYNEKTRHWRRLIAERQTAQDQVVIGLWPWAQSSLLSSSAGYRGSSSGSSGSSSSSIGGDNQPLPLLLRNMTFKPPLSLNLKDVARVLLHIHHKREKYRFYDFNCFWYADLVFTTLRAWGRDSYTEWEWIKYRASALISPWKRTELREAAVAFQSKLATDPYRGEKSGKDASDENKSEEDRVECVTNDVIEDEIKGDDLVMRALKEIDFVKNLDKSAIHRTTADRKKELKAFTTAVLADSEKEKNLEVFKSRVSGEPPEFEEDDDPIFEQLKDALEEIEVDAMTEQEEADYEKALQVFAGDVLKELANEVSYESGQK